MLFLESKFDVRVEDYNAWNKLPFHSVVFALPNFPKIFKTIEYTKY